MTRRRDLAGLWSEVNSSLLKQLCAAVDKQTRYLCLFLAFMHLSLGSDRPRPLCERAQWSVPMKESFHAADLQVETA